MCKAIKGVSLAALTRGLRGAEKGCWFKRQVSLLCNYRLRLLHCGWSSGRSCRQSFGGEQYSHTSTSANSNIHTQLSILIPNSEAHHHSSTWPLCEPLLSLPHSHQLANRHIYSVHLIPTLSAHYLEWLNSKLYLLVLNSFISVMTIVISDHYYQCCEHVY